MRRRRARGPVKAKAGKPGVGVVEMPEVEAAEVALAAGLVEWAAESDLAE